jgi:hypothetical protein
MSAGREYNFDGLVGPTHNYAGLSSGNLASMRHEGDGGHRHRRLQLSPGLAHATETQRMNHQDGRADACSQCETAGIKGEEIGAKPDILRRIRGAILHGDAAWS